VRAANETLRRGATILVLDLDSLSELDDAAIAATIVALRMLRESGGTMRLVTGNPAYRKYLSMTGLDRIVEVCASVRDADQRSERRTRRKEQVGGHNDASRTSTPDARLAANLDRCER
jgi:anti-anti-sigma factor